MGRGDLGFGQRGTHDALRQCEVKEKLDNLILGHQTHEPDSMGHVCNPGTV